MQKSRDKYLSELCCSLFTRLIYLCIAILKRMLQNRKKCPYVLIYCMRNDFLVALLNILHHRNANCLQQISVVAIINYIVNNFDNKNITMLDKKFFEITMLLFWYELPYHVWTSSHIDAFLCRCISARICKTNISLWYHKLMFVLQIL